jgi:hypothetical protein
LQAGLFPALLQASRPQILRSLVATAREHGVEVSGLRKAAVIPAQDAVAVVPAEVAAELPVAEPAMSAMPATAVADAAAPVPGTES